MTRRNLIAVAALLTCLPALKAQTAFDKATDLNFWTSGRNISGIRTASPVKVSFAEASLGAASGGFRPLDGASSLWNAGAVARTLVDLQKFSMLGSFSFRQEQGDGMSGSMFIHPGFYPVDVLEFTPGKKTLQEYSFTGGIAVPLDGRWTVGGRIDFSSANYSKRKDIRHTNYRLDLDVAPSVTLNLDGWTLGASAIVRKTSESVQAEQIGTATADSYYAFLDKGLMFGSYQVWNGSGIHLAEAGVDRFAVKELSAGGALQAQRSFADGEAYTEVELLRTSGEVGEKSYTFYKFPGVSLKALAGFARHGEKGDWTARLSYSWMAQKNNEYIIDKVSSGGVVNPVTYGHNRIFDRRELSLSPRWTFYGKESLAWLHKAFLEAFWTKKEQQAAPQYPHSFAYSADILSAGAGAIVKLSRVRLGASLGWSEGFTKESAETDGEGPSRMEGLWNARVEWETASRVGASLSLRYDLPLKSVQGLYVEAGGSILKGFGIKFLSGTSRREGTLRIGYEF